MKTISHCFVPTLASRLSRCLRGRTARLGVVDRLGDARLALAAAVAVISGLAEGQKGFPRNAGRIVDPGFLRPGVTTIGLSLLDDLPACPLQPRIDFVELVLALDLNAEVVGPAARPRAEIAKFTRGSSSIHLA